MTTVRLINDLELYDQDEEEILKPLKRSPTIFDISTLKKSQEEYDDADLEVQDILSGKGNEKFITTEFKR